MGLLDVQRDLGGKNLVAVLLLCRSKSADMRTFFETDIFLMSPHGHSAGGTRSPLLSHSKALQRGQNPVPAEVGTDLEPSSVTTSSTLEFFLCWYKTVCVSPVVY